MKGNGNAKKLNNAVSLKKRAVSLFLVVISLLALLSVTEAWLRRNSLGSVMDGSGFQYKNSGVVLPQSYRVETYYLDVDSKWKLIATDYERDTDEWKTKWDPNAGILIPGERTEFKTVFTNLTGDSMEASAYLTGAEVDKKLASKVTIGAYMPDVFLYSSDDTSIFHASNDGTYVVSGTVLLADKCELPPFGELTVNWYISISADVDGGNFYALAKADGTFIKNGSNYYSVNSVDNGGNVTEAFECNGKGELVLQNGSLVAYSGSYDGLISKFMTFGNAADTVRISGLYAMAG